jgi:DNA-binding transcriptional regulator YhcF (GntR family)
MIGIGRATLYRAFDKLEQNGTITKKEKIIILNEVD